MWVSVNWSSKTVFTCAIINRCTFLLTPSKPIQYKGKTSLCIWFGFGVCMLFRCLHFV